MVTVEIGQIKHSGVRLGGVLEHESVLCFTDGNDTDTHQAGFELVCERYVLESWELAKSTHTSS